MYSDTITTDVIRELLVAPSGTVSDLISEELFTDRMIFLAMQLTAGSYNKLNPNYPHLRVDPTAMRISDGFFTDIIIAHCYRMANRRLSEINLDYKIGGGTVNPVSSQMDFYKAEADRLEKESLPLMEAHKISRNLQDGYAVLG